MSQKHQRRSVPWPEQLRDVSEPPPIYVKGDDGYRDPRVLSATIKHKFYGDSFIIGREVILGSLNLSMHRISIDNTQTVIMDRRELALPEATIYRIKAHLYKVQKERADAEKDREKIKKRQQGR